MKTISKSKLKSKLLFLRFVESGGKPVVRISRYGNSQSTEELFGQMRGKVKYFEDLTTPTQEWGEL
ncbi:MAG: prevent-host-death protein [Rivularia sp. (in: cyanobacteria)]